MGHERDTQWEIERKYLPEKPMKIVSYSLSNYVEAAARSVKSFDKTTDLAQTKVAISVVHLYLRSTCYKDHLGHLIIEGWNSKLMINIQC